MRYFVCACIALFYSQISIGDVISETVEDISESYEKCEELYEHIRSSECANSIVGVFGRMYLELGLSFTERQVKFQNIETEKDAFILSSGFKPRPVFSISLSDVYFNDSAFGYGFGFSYFDDYAFEQIIKRGSASDNSKTVDLGTYSSMNVIALTPSIFYGVGRNDSSPSRFAKFGIGLNLMYSAVRGTAYITEEKTDADCYDYGSNLIAGSVSDASQLQALCEFTRFRESSYGTGFKIFIDGEWNLWKAELATSLYLHRGNGDYRFVTQQVQIAFSRRFEF